MADTKERLTLVTEKDVILFAAITGKGVDNYDKDGFIYKAAIQVSKDEKKRIKKVILDFYTANKSKTAPEHPANWDNIIYETKEGETAFSAATQTEFDGEKAIVGLYDGRRNPLDPKQYGSIGKGSVGRLSVNLKIYTSGKKEGVSLFLNAVSLSSFVPYSGGGDHSGDFAVDDDADELGGGGSGFDPVNAFETALNDEDFKAAKQLLMELEGHADHKKFKKALKKAKGK